MDGFLNLKTDQNQKYIIKQKKNRIEGFDVLRSIAALMVVISHIVAMTYNPIVGEDTANFLKKVGWSFGAIGVDLFFVLSGFVVARAYQRQISNGLNYFDFLCGRLIRLMPIYLFSMLFSLTVWAFFQGFEKPKNAGASLDLVQNQITYLQFMANIIPIWINNEQIVLNPPWWTLTIEIIAAIAMPVLIKIALKKGALAPFIFGIFIFFASAALDIITGFNSKILICLAPILMGVVIGINPLPLGKAKIIPLILCGLAILSGTAILRTLFGDFDYILRILAMIGSSLILIACAYLKVKGRLMSMLSKNGQTSYALYAMHYPIMIAFVMMAPKSSTDIEIIMIATVSAIFSVIISYPISSIIDQKAINFSKKYIITKANMHEENKIKTAS